MYEEKIRDQQQYIADVRTGTVSSIILIIVHQIFSLARDWSKHITWPNIPQLKLGNIQEYSPIFKTAHIAKKIWWIIKTTASIWGRKYAWMFVFGHYLFHVANSFPRMKLEENCSLLRTDNVHWQISKHIFVPNGNYFVYLEFSIK